MSLNLRKDDTVIVKTGADRGKMGKILKILAEDNAALVEKLHLVRRNSKPTKKNQKGGMVEKESPIKLSNLQYYCNKCSKGVRFGVKILGDGNKVRTCKKCGEILDKTK